MFSHQKIFNTWFTQNKEYAFKCPIKNKDKLRLSQKADSLKKNICKLPANIMPVYRRGESIYRF